MSLNRCPTCGLEYEGVECFVCEPLRRALKYSRQRRRHFAPARSESRPIVSHAELSQPKEKE